MSDFSNNTVKLQPIVLAVGEVFQWHQAERNLPVHSKVSLANYLDVDKTLLQNLRPDVVISTLVCKDFDFLDLAQVLEQSGFTGTYRVITPNLPNPKIVISEAQNLCPNLEIVFFYDPKISARVIN